MCGLRTWVAMTNRCAACLRCCKSAWWAEPDPDWRRHYRQLLLLGNSRNRNMTGNQQGPSTWLTTSRNFSKLFPTFATSTPTSPCSNRVAPEETCVIVFIYWFRYAEEPTRRLSLLQSTNRSIWLFTKVKHPRHKRFYQNHTFPFVSHWISLAIKARIHPTHTLFLWRYNGKFWSRIWS